MERVKHFGEMESKEGEGGMGALFQRGMRHFSLTAGQQEAQKVRTRGSMGFRSQDNHMTSQRVSIIAIIIHT